VWTDDRAGSPNQEIYSAVASIVLSFDNREHAPARGFSLAQNYPNPFNPVTHITWHLPATGGQDGQAGMADGRFVTLRIFDMLGREVATLVNEFKNAGYHTIQWQAHGLSSGVYFYRLTAGDFVETRKLTIMR
jgi:hypothetical protein